MFKQTAKIFSIAILSGMISLTSAKSIKIGSGGEGGNYYQVAQDIVEFCGEEIKKQDGYSVENIQTKGSVENLNGLGIQSKRFSIGFVQEDVYEYFKAKDNMHIMDIKIKKWLKMYPEYIHILIPVNWKPKQETSFWNKLGGVFNFNNKDNKPVTIMSLKNQTVFAKGGAIVSSQALSYFMGLNLNVINVDKVKNVNGPLIIVTGSGDKRVQKLLSSGKWILLSFDGNELNRRARFYSPATLTYTINGQSITVNTVSIMSLAFQRNYRSQKKKKALKDLKMCIKNNIDDLIDDGTSNKWSIIAITNGWNNSENDEE
jgi:hypothetical protein